MIDKKFGEQLHEVVQAIMLALDRKDREREMVSVLLAELHPRVLSEDEIGEGFTAIMLSCEVTVLGSPYWTS